MPSPVRYAEVKRMLEAIGYRFDRIKGSHHIFVKPGAGNPTFGSATVIVLAQAKAWRIG